jgi:hypothetical protein
MLTLMWIAAAAPAAGQSTSSPKEWPVVLIDAGHNNYGIDESDQTFDRFLNEHGFVVKKLEGRIGDHVLDGAQIFHTSNALAPENVGNWNLPTPSAFRTDEIRILVDWVRNGGSLLLAIEHMPMGGSYKDLAAALGIEVSNGFAVYGSRLYDYSQESVAAAGELLFLRDDGSMADHPVITGDTPYGPIEYLATDTGSAFRLPENSTSLITLGPDVITLEPERSWVFTEDTPQYSVAGWSQAVIMDVGDGRVAVLGDNFLLSAPAYLEPPFIEDDTEAERGAHNHKFTLNLYRWLSRQDLNAVSE